MRSNPESFVGLNAKENTRMQSISPKILGDLVHRHKKKYKSVNEILGLNSETSPILAEKQPSHYTTI